MASKVARKVAPGNEGQTSKKGGQKREKIVDPNRCSTPRCKGTPGLTHLGKPLCDACWQRRCATEDEGAQAARDLVAGDEAQGGTEQTPTAEPVTTVAAAVADDAPPPAEVSASAVPAKTPEAATESKVKRLSAIDAAAQILEADATPMTVKELIVAMNDRGLWSSPKGKTPHATLFSAILREIKTKGKASRFRKANRGKFEVVGATATA